MPIFMPSASPPPAVEYAEPRYGGAPIVASVNGLQYAVTGNTLLPPALIKVSLMQATGPKSALSRLLKLYHRFGYTLVAITGQVHGTRVTVRVYEGMITDLEASRRLRPYFGGVRWRRSLKKSELIRDQILANAYAARSGHDVKVNLSPATNPGAAQLAVNETPKANYFPISGVLTFGNYGSRYASGYVAGGQVVANATHGIQITASLTQGIPGLRQISQGSNYYQNAVGASIVTPYGLYGFQANWTHFRLGNATYPLNPDGNIFSYQFTGTQLVYADASTRISLNEGLEHVRYKETVFNGFYTLLNQHYTYLSLGANANHGVTVAGLTGNLDAGVTFNLGISAPSGTLYDNQPGYPTPHFRYSDFTLTYRQALPLGLEAKFSGQAQWAADTLPSQQQWVLGGLGNLSAYEPGVVVGDSGYVANLEVDAPTLKRAGASATFGGFVETGGATYAHPAHGTSPWQTLSDIGLLLRLHLPYGFSATAMAATPIARSGFGAAGRRNLAANRLDAFFVVQKEF